MAKNYILILVRNIKKILKQKFLQFNLDIFNKRSIIKFNKLRFLIQEVWDFQKWKTPLKYTTTHYCVKILK